MDSKNIFYEISNFSSFGWLCLEFSFTLKSNQDFNSKIDFQGKDGYTVNVTVISGDHSTVLARAFTYVSSLNPVIVSLSRNRSSIAGKIPVTSSLFSL